MCLTAAAKKILVVVTSLLCFLAVCQAQQTSEPVSLAPPAAAPAGSEHLSKPALPGARTVLVEGEHEIPKRVNPDYEDWSKPELTPGMRTETLVLARAEDKDFTKELVHVQWRELDPIDLWVVKPTGVAHPPVILYLYSYPSSNEQYKSAEVCRFLTKNGFAAVGFVSALTEQRFHDRPKRDWFVTQFQEALGSTVHDVQMVLNYLDSRGDLDMNRVGMWGDGSGASIAIMAAGVDPRIKVLDLLNPWGDWPEWLAKSTLVPETQRAGLLQPEFLQSVQNLEPLKWLPQLKTPLVRIQTIEKGVTVTPDSVRQRMEAAAPPNAQIVHYSDVKTFATEVGSAGKSFDWIKKQLNQPFPVRVDGTQSMTKVAPKSTKDSDR